MSVSIVIPAHNAQAYLASTIESVLSQSYADWHLVIVDDGSRDNTVSIAAEFSSRDPRIGVVGQPNSGTACARNRGLAESRPDTDYLLFLDHDDTLQGDAIDCLVRAVNSSPGAVGAHGLAQKVDTLGQPIGEGQAAIQNYKRRKLVDGKIVTAGRQEPTTAAMLVYDNVICTPGQVLVRRADAEKVLRSDHELFDPTAVPLDDWDFWLRLTRFGDLAYVDRVVLDWRRHEKAGSTDNRAMSAAEMRIRKQLIESDLPAELASVANFRYRHLLRTEQRRAARAALGSAGDRLSLRDIRGGAGSLGLALRHYASYLGLRRTAGTRDG